MMNNLQQFFLDDYKSWTNEERAWISQPISEIIISD